MSKVNLKNAQVNILIEVDGDICLVAMTKESKVSIEMLVKMSAERLVLTKRTQANLNEYLGVDKRWL